MNKEEKRKPLMSSGGIFVDIFIGFLIAVCTAAIVYRCFIYTPSVSQTEGESYMVYFEIEDALPEYIDYLKGGAAVYDEQSGLRLGTLAVHNGNQLGSAVAVEEDQDGDGTVTLKGVFRSREGEFEQGSLVLDGTYRLTPGQTLEIYTETASLKVCITKVTAQMVNIVSEGQ